MGACLRTLLGLALAISCTIPLAHNTELSSPACESAMSEIEAARRIFFFAFPLYEMSRMRQRMLLHPEAELNTLVHRTSLSQPSDRAITTPNTDTLYSSAWLDLSVNPVRLTIPVMGSRYHSVHLMHAFSDTFAVLRNDAGTARQFLVVGPDWDEQASPHETVIRSPTRDAWLVVRTFVQGPSDLAEAQRLQGEVTLDGDARAPREAEERIPARPDGGQFLAVVNAVLGRGPIPTPQAERIGCLAGMMAIRANGDTRFKIDPAMRAVFDRNLSAFYDEAGQAFEHSGSLKNGWRYPAPHMGAFGDDDVYRSAMALGGLAAMPINEAINPLTTQDAAGVPLAGSSRYRLSISGSVPVDAFWSLTLYESDGAGRWFLYQNPIGRHAVNSAASDIELAADGTIVLDISHRPAAGGTNWLPAPKGRFLLVFRAYRPRSDFVDGSFHLPAVERIDAHPAVGM